MTNTPKQIICLSYFLAVLAGFWLLGFIIFNNYIFSYTFNSIYKKDNLAGITALTGGRNRIAKAISMLNNEIGARLLISGVKKETSLEDIIKREDITLTSNHPIDLGQTATDTVGNAKEIKQWADTHKIKKIYIVTSFYHIPRTRLELEHYVPDKELIYVPTPSSFVSPKWWKKWSSFKFLSREYTKFLIVYVQYKVLGL